MSHRGIFNKTHLLSQPLSTCRVAVFLIQTNVSLNNIIHPGEGTVAFQNAGSHRCRSAPLACPCQYSTLPALQENEGAAHDCGWTGLPVGERWCVVREALALSVTDTPVGVPLFLSVNKLARSPLFPVLPGLPSPKQS